MSVLGTVQDLQQILRSFGEYYFKFKSLNIKFGLNKKSFLSFSFVVYNLKLKIINI